MSDDMVASLLEENRRLQTELDRALKNWSLHSNRAGQLRQRLAEAEEALQFYAAPGAWRGRDFIVPGQVLPSEAERDQGKKARAYLNKHHPDRAAGQNEETSDSSRNDEGVE